MSLEDFIRYRRQQQTQTGYNPGKDGDHPRPPGPTPESGLKIEHRGDYKE